MVIFLGGCGTAQTVTTRTPLYKYRADVRISAQGKVVDGMISIPRSEPTRIQIDSPVKMDLVRISSCNRDMTTEKVGYTGTWLDDSRKRFVYEYQPTAVESEQFCPLYIQVFDDKLLTAWGFVGFRTTEKLKAVVSCNGAEYQADGVDSCQSLYGFEQGLSFEVPVKYATSGPCDVRRKDDKTLRVRTSAEGFCLLTAYDGKDFFKFILLGYSSILVRGRANPIEYGGSW